MVFVYVMITFKMEQKINELEKNTDQQFEAQSEMIKSVYHEVCVLLIANLKATFREEIKKEIDERVNYKKHMLQQQVTSLKQVNLQIQNDMKELEQYNRCLCLRIDWVPIKEKKRHKDVFEHMGMFEEPVAGNVDEYIDRSHQIRRFRRSFRRPDLILGRSH